MQFPKCAQSEFLPSISQNVVFSMPVSPDPLNTSMWYNNRGHQWLLEVSIRCFIVKLMIFAIFVQMDYSASRLLRQVHHSRHPPSQCHSGCYQAAPKHLDDLHRSVICLSWLAPWPHHAHSLCQQCWVVIHLICTIWTDLHEVPLVVGHIHHCIPDVPT